MSDSILMTEVRHFDTQALRAEWAWLVPGTDTPLFISAFGDWVFGKPNGSLWVLSLLEGTYAQVARDSGEHNILNKSAEWLDQIFLASWLPIAAGHGLIPSRDQCIGWKVHPIMGGKFEPANLQLFSMLVYQTIMGQLHRQLQSKS